MSPTPNLELQVKETALGHGRFVESPAPEGAAPGTVVVRVEKFGLSANNVTYGALGRTFRYFEFFPADPGWGKIPVWGMARVVHAGHGDLPPGTRLYGYLPLARFATLAVAQRTPTGFDVDRGTLPAVYNQYALVGSDPFHLPEREDHMLLFRPLFFTSLLLDDYLADGRGYHGADTVILTSASAKTAWGLAYLLSRRTGPTRREVVGLTAARHRAFVEGLGFYDRVLTYDEVGSLARETHAVLVDVAGNVATLAAVQQRLGAGLRASILVGMSHWDRTQGDGTATHSEMFFAPSWVEERRKQWGLDRLVATLVEGWRGFMRHVDRWCRLEHAAGQDAVERTWRRLLAGETPPDEGAVCSLWDDAFSGVRR